MRWVRCRNVGSFSIRDRSFTEGKLYMLDESELCDDGYPTVVDDNGTRDFAYWINGELRYLFEEVTED